MKNSGASDHSFHPLETTFDQISAIAPHLPVKLGWGKEGVPAEEFFNDPSPAFEGMLDRIRRNYQTSDDSVLASFFMNAYSWPLVSAGLSCLLIDSRLPDLGVENAVLYPREDSKITSIAFRSSHWFCLKEDPASDHPRAHSVEANEDLHAVFRSQLEAHLETVIDYVGEILPWGKRALWLTAADRCGEALIWISKHTPPDILDAEEVPHLYDRLFSHAASPLKNALTSVEVDHGGLFMQRGACCLAYRLTDHDYCQNCPINSTQ